MRLRFRLRHVVAFAPLFVSTLGAQSLPSRLTDKELWQLNADFSEANGYFRSDNFLSNETGFQYVIPTLKTLVHPGSVYLGVGPEQNFTYIVALQPKIAFIFDIRRGNMIAHLMYKTLFETSADRAEFLSKLFSRPRPAGLTESSTPQQLFDAYIAAVPDSALYRRNLAAIKEHLTKTHAWVMNDSDSKLMDYTYSAFFGGGPELNYNYRPGMNNYGGGRFGGGFGGNMPNYATLQSATDADGKELGVSRHRSELPLAQGFRVEESACAGRRRLRGAEGDPLGREILERPRRRRWRVLYIERRAVPVSGRRLGAVLSQRGDASARCGQHVHSLDRRGLPRRVRRPAVRQPCVRAIPSSTRRTPAVGDLLDSGSHQGVRRREDHLLRGCDCSVALIPASRRGKSDVIYETLILLIELIHESPRR